MKQLPVLFFAITTPYGSRNPPLELLSVMFPCPERRYLCSSIYPVFLPYPLSSHLPWRLLPWGAGPPTPSSSPIAVRTDRDLRHHVISLNPFPLMPGGCGGVADTGNGPAGVTGGDRVAWKGCRSTGFRRRLHRHRRGNFSRARKGCLFPQRHENRNMIGRLFPGAFIAVDGEGFQPVRHAGRKQGMVNSQA